MTSLKSLYIAVKNKLLGTYGSFKYAAAFVAVDPLTPSLNDASFSGDYTQNVDTDLFTVEIDSTGTTDTFKFTRGTIVVTGILITGASQWLQWGVSITFGAITGHTLGDKWTYKVTGEVIVKFAQVWNNQVKHIQAELEGTIAEGMPNYAFPLPAVFVELISQHPILQNGNRIQSYDELIVRIHYVHEFYNATKEGFMDEDFLIFEQTQRLYAMLQGFEPDGAVAFVRVAETEDTTHNMIYHFIQDYKTNLVDNTLDAPHGYIEKPPPTDYELNLTKMVIT